MIRKDPMNHHFTHSLFAILIVAISPIAPAHEYWFRPLPNPMPLNSTAQVALQVGEYFVGETVGLSDASATEFWRYSATGREDLLPLLPARIAVGQVPVKLSAPGTQLLAWVSYSRDIELPAERFHAYLHDEGLDAIKALREANKTAQKPGRERYRRYVKTLIEVSGRRPTTLPLAGASSSAAAASGVGPSNQPDAVVSPSPSPSPSSSSSSGSGLAPAVTIAVDTTFATRVGLRLEVMPLNNPLTMRVGESLALQIVFDGSPLPGALVKAWHTSLGQTVTLRAITSASGNVSFNLPYRGPWMVSVVHMEPARGVKNIDWASLWGNLSFVVP